ncbi:hypothetical protein PUG42_26950, partial [Erwiniaceae bacterium L1_54_3]|nr:hypothetical protein [Erwiniaceae bacterium L1_54_3]
WRILRFPPSESNTFFSVFLRRDESLYSLLSRLRCRFAVSVVAQYRDFLRADKCYFKVFAQPLTL